VESWLGKNFPILTFHYMLISVKIIPGSMYQGLVMEDIRWLDVEKDLWAWVGGKNAKCSMRARVWKPQYGVIQVSSLEQQ